MQIDVSGLTLKEYLRFKKIRIRGEIEKEMDIPTYYRLIKNEYKNGPHEASLEKLRNIIGIERDLFDILLENERKEVRENKKEKELIK